MSLLDTDAKALVRASPPLPTQLSALLRRSALNVARDPYLASLHIVLTLCVGLVVGSLFKDLGRLNRSTAGVQVWWRRFFYDMWWLARRTRGKGRGGRRECSVS